MVMDMNGDEIVDAPEIAERLGFKTSRQVLDLRVHRLGFPDPVARHGRKLMWSWSQVDAWATIGLGTLTRAHFNPAS
jgi:predicted DNA-binding transcriptional regulator AlpA